MAKSGRTPAGERRLEDQPIERLAQSYWRLWRRNWRPPFPAEDAPSEAGARAETNSHPRRRSGDRPENERTDP
ncbi:MAG: hypothetical protein AAF909_01565 [Pseudomonadota bacterium]